MEHRHWLPLPQVLLQVVLLQVLQRELLQVLLQVLRQVLQRVLLQVLWQVLPQVLLLQQASLPLLPLPLQLSPRSLSPLVSLQLLAGSCWRQLLAGSLQRQAQGTPEGGGMNHGGHKSACTTPVNRLLGDAYFFCVCCKNPFLSYARTWPCATPQAALSTHTLPCNNPSLP